MLFLSTWAAVPRDGAGLRHLLPPQIPAPPRAGDSPPPLQRPRPGTLLELSDSRWEGLTQSLELGDLLIHKSPSR